MAATALDSVEGTVDGVLQFHYDMTGDVLYLQLISALGRDSYSEETDEGMIVVKDMQTDRPIGLTIVSYWRRFGDGRALGAVSLDDLNALLSVSAAKAAKVIAA